MLANDYSQLPVMTGERDVGGVVSWASVGSKLALGGINNDSEVQKCMERANVVGEDESLFDAIQTTVTNQYVLVADSKKRITGIVTTSDLSEQFRQLAEPFLLLSEIENQIRQIVERGQFTRDELLTARDPNDKNPEIDGVADLTMGEYLWLLQSPESWSKLKLASIDRVVFVHDLNEIREVRNEVMHFDPDPISAEQLCALRKFSSFLKKLKSILPT